MHAFESLAASRRAKQDHGRLLDMEVQGKADAATEAALGLYALPDHDYRIGTTNGRSAQLSVMASVYSPLLPLAGHALWYLLSKRRHEPNIVAALAVTVSTSSVDAGTSEHLVLIRLGSFALVLHLCLSHTPSTFYPFLGVWTLLGL